MSCTTHVVTAVTAAAACVIGAVDEADHHESNKDSLMMTMMMATRVPISLKRGVKESVVMIGVVSRSAFIQVVIRRRRVIHLTIIELTIKL